MVVVVVLFGRVSHGKEKDMPRSGSSVNMALKLVCHSEEVELRSVYQWTGLGSGGGGRKEEVKLVVLGSKLNLEKGMASDPAEPPYNQQQTPCTNQPTWPTQNSPQRLQRAMLKKTSPFQATQRLIREQRAWESTARPIVRLVRRPSPIKARARMKADGAYNTVASNEQPTGEILTLNDVEAYVTKPADYPHASSKLLLLLTGGTGIHSKNNQIQADKFAAEGYVVVMPDQFAGNPASSVSTTQTNAAEENPSIIEQVKLGVAAVAKSFTIDMWLARHTPEKVLPILQKAITGIRDEYGDAVANGGGIYAVGYCFGARYVLLLGSELHADVAAGQRSPETQAEEGMTKKGPEIKVGAIAHGTQVSVSDLENCTVPLGIVAVEQDSLFPDHIRDKGVEKLKEKGIETEVQVYPGVPHGFAVFGDYADETIKSKQQQAFQQLLEWLQSH